MPHENKSSTDELVIARQPRRTNSLVVSLLVASLVGLSTFALARYWLPATMSAAPAIPAAAAIRVGEDPAAETSSRIAMRASFFDSGVEPEIEKTDQLNREAAERCVRRLHGLVSEYRSHVEPFVEDLTSISTRLGIVRRMPGGWWSEDGRVEDYVAEKFERHLFSEKKILADVESVLDQFRSEVDANQKRMLVNVRACLDTADLPEVEIEEYDKFYQSVARQLSQYSAQQGSSSVGNALTVLVISEAGSYAAVTIVSGLLVRFGAMAATTTATAGGVTVGASATGAGSGSLAGPVGTAVGLGVGLVIGLAVDWWMTEEFEEEMSLQLNDYLISLERAILYGSEPTDAGQSDAVVEEGGGVADALPRVCERLKLAYREKFYEQIVTVEILK
ncbi:MAG: hypothetical protein OSA98_19945 [Rubripirellula sp.]|nr:hypothetical protein [Rubripirellula sp.]